jgi:hypothetical protein
MARLRLRLSGNLNSARTRASSAIVIAAFLGLAPAIAGASVVTAQGDTAANYSLSCGSMTNPSGTTAVLNEGSAACGNESWVLVSSGNAAVATFYGKVYAAGTTVRGRELEVWVSASAPGDLTFKFGWATDSTSPTAFNELASGTGIATKSFPKSIGYVRYLVDLRAINGSIPATRRLVFRVETQNSTFRGGVMVRTAADLPSMKLSYFDNVAWVPGNWNDLPTAAANAATGTTIVVKDGTHTGVQLNVSGKQLVFVSENGPENSVIDGQYTTGTFLTLPAGATNQTALEGFTIKRYTSSAVFSNASYPIIRNCVFRDNDASNRDGGGIRLGAQSAMGGAMLVEGCTFIGNRTSGPVVTDNDGGAIAVSGLTNTALLTIKGCTFLRNTSTEDGGAVFVEGSLTDVKILDSVFVQNSAQTGGGLHAAAAGAVKVERCRFERNYAETAGAVYSARVALLNSIFVQNAAAGAAGAVLAIGGTTSAHTVLDFCTLTGNYALAGGGVAVNALTGGSSAYATVVNSILWGDWHTSNALGKELYLGTRGTNTILAGRSDIAGGTAGALLNSGTLTEIDGRNIADVDPLFAFADAPRLMPGSPCIDQGIMSPTLPSGMGLSLPSYDADFVYRYITGTSGGAPDLGAYEYHGDWSQPQPVVSPERVLLIQRQGGPPPDVISLSIRNASTKTLPWAVETDVAWLQARPPASGELTEGIDTASVIVDSAGLAAGEYRGRIRVRVNSDDAPAWPADSPRVVEVILNVTKQHTVCASGCDQTTIQAAVDASGPGDEVLVMDGTYAGGITTRGKDLALRSANGRDATSIDCAGAVRGITVPMGSLRETVIEGFTIENCVGAGTPKEGGGIWSGPLTKLVVLASRLQNNVLGIHASGTKGGGMYVGWWANVARSEFLGNDADWGGGIYVGPSLEGMVGIEETRFAQNIASNGGGIYLSQSATGYSMLLGNIFESNTTGGGRTAIPYGMGAYLTGSNIGVEACTFTANGSGTGFGGGMYLSATGSLLMNNLFTNNQSATGGGLYVPGGNAWITNSTFYGNYAYSGASGGGGVFLEAPTGSVLSNCLVTGNGDGVSGTGTNDVSPQDDPAARVQYSHVRTWTTTANNNIIGGTATAHFVNAAGGDFRLLPTSALIDKGTTINWLFSDLRRSARAVDGDSDGVAKFDIGAYEYSRYFGGIGEDATAAAFRDLTVNGSILATGYEYRIEWKDKDPFPQQIDERVRQAGEYDVRLLLMSEGGHRVTLGTWTMPVGSQYTVPFTFGADHIGTWRLRLQMVADINQYVESEPISIQYKELVPYTLGKKIPPPVGALPGLKPDVDDEDAVYWSTETNELYAIAPNPVQLTWYADQDRSIPLLVMGMIKTPTDPQFYIVGSPPVEVLPDGSRFSSAEIMWTEGGATISSNQFRAVSDGWTTLLFRDPRNNDPAQRELFTVTRSLTWDHQGTVAVSGPPYNGTLGPTPPVDPILPLEATRPIGVKVEDGEHAGDAVCGGGHVFFELAPYDGAGEYRAHDRATRSGPIYLVNEDDPDAIEDDLLVVWYRKHDATGICWPFKPVRYDPTVPSSTVLCPGTPPGNCDLIDITSGQGSGALPPETFGVVDNMILYNQSDRRLPGFNPNEEHAMIFPAQGTPYPGVFPLRSDLNQTAWNDPPFSLGNPAHTSPRLVLVKYRDPATGEWSFKTFGVQAGSLATTAFAGNEINPPYPLNQFVFGPCRDDETTAATREGTYTDASPIEVLQDKDDKLFFIQGGGITVRSYFYYRLQEDFWLDRDHNTRPDKLPGACIPWLDGHPGGTFDTFPAAFTYTVNWPTSPTLHVGETLADAKTQAGETVGLPNIKDQCRVQKVFDQAHVRLFDPLKEYDVDLPSPLPGAMKLDPPTGMGSTVKFKDLPPQLQSRLVYDDVAQKLKLKGLYVTDTGEPVLLMNTLSNRELALVQGLPGASDDFKSAVQHLKDFHGDPGLLGADSISRWEADFKVVSAGKVDATGYVTLAFNNDERCPAPTMVSVIHVGCPLYTGALKVVESPNPFEEKLTMRHNGDFGGKPDERFFQWMYLQGFSGIPKGPGTDGELWFPFDPDNSSPGPTATPPPTEVTVGDDVFSRGLVDITPLGTGQQLLPDRWFSVRYNYNSGGLCTSDVSPWTPPQLAEGWIKRVMKKINLFDQKVKDFHQSPTDTVASMIAEAGRAYEGDVALSDDPAYLNQLGLIELYETLLHRALDLSLDAPSPDPTLLQAVLFATTRLNALYMLLGNEAYADSADPTVGFGTKDGQYGAMAPSMFAFQNQADTLLEEELSLLRGRPDTGIRPFYNRLPWNFTIGEGEVAYRQVYNITDVTDTAGTGEPDGEINEFDAKALFPQGHGDAWGYYTSALKKWYYLVTHKTLAQYWVPQTEAILVAQAPIHVDYRDERAFATAAAARARAGADIVGLTYRDRYDEDPERQWKGYRDTDPSRAWGLAEWGSRAGEGAYIDWAVGNALLPSVAGPTVKYESYPAPGQRRYVLGRDYAHGTLVVTVDPGAPTEAVVTPLSVTELYDATQGRYTTEILFSTAPAVTTSILFKVTLATAEGIAKVDRTTVVELHEIPGQFDAIQAVLDQADAGLNPLGVAKDTVPFDIDPALVSMGQTHFEQIYGRAGQALQNAVSVFDYANQGSQLLRRQQDSLDAFKRTIADREADFTNRLVEIFGYPYPEDCGPGKVYPTGYCDNGPDLYHYMYVEPSYLMGLGDEVDNDQPDAVNEDVFQVTFRQPQTNAQGEFVVGDSGDVQFVEQPVTFTVDEDRRFGLIRPKAWTGKRKAAGALQLARADLLQLRGRFERALKEYSALVDQMENEKAVIEKVGEVNTNDITALNTASGESGKLNEQIKSAADSAAEMLKAAQDAAMIANGVMELFPKTTGFSFDLMGAFRSAVLIAGQVVTSMFTGEATSSQSNELSNSQSKEATSEEMNLSLVTNRGELTKKQQLQPLENLVRQEGILRQEMYTQHEALNQSAARYLNALAAGERTLAERLRFRKQTAAQVQDYRYTDMTFRVFRNDALQKYKAQFDLAARYVYLAAKAYDYETTLLDASSMAGRAFLTDIVKQRSLGTILGGQPLAGSGLADTMRRLSQNFQVLKPQLGFNNPQKETNRFSLRREMLRIKADSGSNQTWRDALSSYVKPDLWAVPEFRRYCRPFAAPGAAQPGLVIPFRTTVSSGANFFGWPLGGGDSYYSAANFATKVRSVGVWFSNYNAVGLAQTPRVYLVPAGEDILRSPTGGTGDIRSWHVLDQRLPAPQVVTTQEMAADRGWIPAVDTVLDEFGAVRRHADFKAYHDSGYLDPAEMTYDSRLIGRSVWNTKWLLIIPGRNLLWDPNEALETFVNGPEVYGGGGERSGNGISDIKLFFETYAYTGY